MIRPIPPDEARQRESTAMFGLIFTVVAVLSNGPLLASDPPAIPTAWSAEVDQFFAAEMPRGQLSTDSEFIRRVSIDLTAMPPSAEDVVSFLADTDPEKRNKLIDRLIASPQFDRHLAATLDLILMERRPYRDIKEDQWDAYLLQAVRQNRPWNELAREILSATGEGSGRAAVRFALIRDAEPNLLTRDIGRIFFGKDLQCAQCHDHPLVDDYLQSDYQGLYAFVAPGYIKTITRTEPDPKDPKKSRKVSEKVYAEKDGNDINFQSVFIKDTKHRTGPRVIGQVALLEPDLFPTVGSPAITPPFSRRQKFAEHSTDGTNRAFNENIANRLWAHLFGSGLVNPPDFHHRDNPPVNPELMKFLGTKIAEIDFDMKEFIGELARTKVYQNTFDFPASRTDRNQVRLRLEELRAEKAQLDSQLEELSEKYANSATQWQEAESRHLPGAMNVEKLKIEWVAASTPLTKLQGELTKQTEAYQLQRDVRENLVGTAESLNAVAKLDTQDQELAKTVKLLLTKLEKVQKASEPLRAKVLATEKNLAGFKTKEQTAKKKLESGFREQAPLRNELNDAEKASRVLRDEMEGLITRQNSLASEIATLEKSFRFLELTDSSDQDEEMSQERESLIQSLNTRYARRFTIAPLKPLTPEQFCWSVLKVTGVYDRYWMSESKKFRAAKKLSDEVLFSPEQTAEIESKVYTALKGNLALFVRYYGSGAGQPQGDFFATADQALFAVNGSQFNSYVNPSSANVTERMLKAATGEDAARTLYLTLLSRQPTAGETVDVTGYLAKRTDPAERRSAVIELVWSLLNSAEFRFNH